MKKLSLALFCIFSFAFVNFSNAAEKNFSYENIGDTAALKKSNSLTLNSITYNKKFSLNIRKEMPKQNYMNYNSFDIRSKKPAYIQSVLMRKGNSIQAVPIYVYTLPF